MIPKIVLMTNRYSPVVEILQESCNLSLVGIIHMPLPNSTDRTILDFAEQYEIPLFTAPPAPLFSSEENYQYYNN